MTTEAAAVSSLRKRIVLRAIHYLAKLIHEETSRDPYHTNFNSFLELVAKLPAPTVVELGSRNVSGSVVRGRVPQGGKYIGFDVLAGNNVDVVGDAHQLGKHFAPESVDAIFSISVFEHLAMPWQAMLEINRTLKEGGLFFVSTHPTWPAHEQPWDFWRYSAESFKVLLNKETGFEILYCAEGLNCSIVPHGYEPAMRGMTFQTAKLGVSVVARKIGPAKKNLEWDIDAVKLLTTSYPHQYRKTWL